MKKKLRLKKNIKKVMATTLLLLALYTVITYALMGASDYIQQKDIEQCENR